MVLVRNRLKYPVNVQTYMYNRALRRRFDRIYVCQD